MEPNGWWLVKIVVATANHVIADPQENPQEMVWQLGINFAGSVANDPGIISELALQKKKKEKKAKYTASNFDSTILAN